MKDGSPTLSVDGSALRIAVIAASWHDTVMNGLIAGAHRGLAEAGVTTYDLVRVPGTFELTSLRPGWPRVTTLSSRWGS